MFSEKIKKTKMGAQQWLNSKPVVLVGTVIDGKANFITVSWAGITSDNPPTMSIAIRNIRYSLKGIKENMTFSVNIPSADLVKETDYCGTLSGSVHNKVQECGFKIFYGKTKDAPMIEQCPINMECEIFKIIDIGDHSVIVGKIIESYFTTDCFTNEVPDIRKINPLCFCTFTTKSMGYYKIGELVAGTENIKN